MTDKEVPLNRPRLGEWLAALGVACGLVVLFWGPICPWNGGSLIGGDLFPYFFPQKAFLADSLSQGDFPLWNNRVGAGYPLIAESQTGALYPPTLLLFATLDLNTAYHVGQLLHFVIAFMGFWAYARTLGIRWTGAILAALIVVYGWFAPRICLEWAIIGGAWMPWIFRTVEQWLQSGNRRSLLWLAPLMGGFLLAGHFHLAFITTLALVLYVPARLITGTTFLRTEPKAGRHGLKYSLGVSLAVLGLGYLIAAVQLVPTLELMTRSQRSERTAENDPAYGHIPPWYLTQILSQWVWTGPEVNPDGDLQLGGAGGYPASTNRVEAHLYFGMVPLVLGVLLLVQRGRGKQSTLAPGIGLWLLIGLVGVAIATGWPLLILKYLPGFGYFRGAGRYGVLMAIGAALLAGMALERLAPPRGMTRLLIEGMVIGLTVWDFYTVTPAINYSLLLHESVVEQRMSSPIGRELASASEPVRLWAPGANVATTLPVSAWPVYLGLGPNEYFDRSLMTTLDDKNADQPEAIARHIEWMRRHGVTHLLSMAALPAADWPGLTRVRIEPDMFFAMVWARYEEPVRLYQLEDMPTSGVGRIASESGAAVAFSDYMTRANEVSFTVEVDTPQVIELRDLAYPGWSVTVDGIPVPAQTTNGLFRGVAVTAGKHRIEWRYRPRSLWLGGVVSLASLLVWATLWRRSGRMVPLSTGIPAART